MDVHELTAEHRRMACELWRGAGLTRPWNSPEEDFDRALSGPTSTVLGVVIDDEVVATAMVGHDGHRGWVYYLAVTEDERRRGVGRDLMTAGEKWLHERGARKVQLMVRRTNSVVLGFYERLGYEDAQTVVLAKWLEKK